jgi:hypothetical protein
MKVSPSRPNPAKYALCALLALLPATVSAQARFDVDDPSFDDLKSPEVGGNTSVKRFTPKDWLEVEVKFKISDSGSKAEFVDRVNIRWYVAVKNPEGRGYWLLEKSVTHVNVPVGEDVFASVYLSPNGVKRLSGSDRASKSVVEYVGGEIEIGGNRQIFVNKGSKTKPFWTVASDSLSRTEKVPLLNKNETPFRFLWHDRYAEIEERD